MATPIPFSVSASARPAGFTFTSPSVAKPAGYSKIYWELDLPTRAQYEDALNEIDVYMSIGSDESLSVWRGGPATNKAGAVDPAPAFQYDIAAIPAGTPLQVRVVVVRAMTVGIKNGAVT